jgi:hypothetical protein
MRLGELMFEKVELSQNRAWHVDEDKNRGKKGDCGATDGNSGEVDGGRDDDDDCDCNTTGTIG